MKKKDFKKDKEKKEPLSKLEAEVAKTNPEFVDWLKTRKKKTS